MTLKYMVAAPGPVRQVSARLQVHITRGRPADVPPLHPQPELWSSPCRVADAELILQRSSSGMVTEEKFIPKKKKGTEEQTNRVEAERGMPLGSSSAFSGFIWGMKPYGQLSMKHVLSARCGRDIPHSVAVALWSL